MTLFLGHKRLRATLLASTFAALVLGGFGPLASASSPQPDGSKATTVTEVVTNKKLAPMLMPNSAQLARAALDRYADVVNNGGFPKVPRGTYSRGKVSSNIQILNQRLYLEGYIPQSAVTEQFSVLTEQGVAKFQRNVGLAVTGKIDGPTITALNIPANVRLRTLEANIPRLEIYTEKLGTRYVVVNVPSQTIETVSNGRLYSRHNAIVGRPERPTPVVMTPLKLVRFNPYWNAPVSIAENDIIPKLKGGTSYLEENNIKVFQGFGGPEVNPSEVDWSTAVPDDYLFRQEPGPTNAMATAKIEFTSPFGIYLHDTPDKGLFKSGNRFFSSGCVRVDKMPMLVNWVLNGQDGINSDVIAAYGETLERVDTELTDPPQLRVAYLTAWPVSDGTVAFRRDIYEMDETGFTVGQPLPVGELSEEGLRYVLKPVPRLAAQVDEAEAQDFNIFKSSKAKGKVLAKPAKPVTTVSADDEDIGVFKRKPKLAPKKVLPVDEGDNADLDLTSQADEPTQKKKSKPALEVVEPKPVIKSVKPITVAGRSAKKKNFLFDFDKPTATTNSKESALGVVTKKTQPKSALDSTKSTQKPITGGSLFSGTKPAGKKAEKKQALTIGSDGRPTICGTIAGLNNPVCKKPVKKIKASTKATKLKAKPAGGA